MKKQPDKKKTLGTALKPRKPPSDRVVFPEARGRTVELVELFAGGDYNCVSIRFQDSTDLTVVVDPALTFSASFSRWKAGNERVLKRWPAIRS
jgi:hypothetical protein